jgi:hypothetical protein
MQAALQCNAQAACIRIRFFVCKQQVVHLSRAGWQLNISQRSGVSDSYNCIQPSTHMLHC